MLICYLPHDIPRCLHPAILSSEIGTQRQTARWDVLIALVVISLLSAGAASSTLSGSWESGLTLSEAGTLLEFESDLELAYAIDDWELEGELGFGTDGWEKAQVEASTEIGTIEVSSLVSWEPAKGRLKKWSGDVSAELRGARLDVSLDVYRDHCWTDLRVRGDLARGEYDIETRFGEANSFCLDYYRTDIDLSFSVRDVPIELDGRFTAEEGFEYVDVEADIPLPPFFSWLALNADVRISTSGTDRSFEPSLVADVVCEASTASLEFLGEVISAGGAGVDGIAVVGVILAASQTEWWAESRTSLHPDWNKKIAKHKAFYGAVGGGCTLEGSHERRVDVETWAYFSKDGSLFGWARTDAQIVVELSASLELTAVLILESDGVEEIRMHGDVRW
jgi:hypothetical protein